MSNEVYNIVTGVVVNNDDPYGGCRIQVRMGNVDDGIKSDEELQWCSPLMPKLIHVVPKKDEAVFILTQKSGASNSNRFYIGPVLSQPQRYYKELAVNSKPFVDNPDGVGNTTLPTPYKPSNKGSIPDVEDIAIIGRSNSMVLLKENELRLMCGMMGNPGSNVNEKLAFNNTNPSFIQMKYKPGENGESIMNIFSDRINLLSRKSDVNVGSLDGQELMTEKELKRIMDNCHPLVYGDILINYLNQMRKAISTHTHKYSMLPPVTTPLMISITDADLNEMLSQSIKTC